MLNYNYSFEKAKQNHQKEPAPPSPSSATTCSAQGNHFVRSHKRSDSVSFHGRPLELLESPIIGVSSSRKSSHNHRRSLDTPISNHSLYRRDSADTPPESPVSLDKGLARLREPSIDLDIVSAQSDSIIRRQQALLRQGSATMIRASHHVPLSPTMADARAPSDKEKPRSYSISYQPHNAVEFDHQGWKETPRKFIRRCDSAGAVQRKYSVSCRSHVKRSLSQNDCKSSSFDLKSFLMEYPQIPDGDEHESETDSELHTPRENDGCSDYGLDSLKSDEVSLPASSEDLLARFDDSEIPHNFDGKQSTNQRSSKSYSSKPKLFERSSTLSKRFSRKST